MWALLALLIPIIIHLFNFKRYRTVYFSNNRFLQALQKKSKSFNKLKHWIILLSRLLALACLVFAFAQPFFPAKEKSDQNSSLVSIYIDNSLSMKNKGLNGSLLEDARSEAVNLVKALPKNYKFQIISNDLESRQKSFYNSSQAIRLIDELKPSNAFRSIHEISKQIKGSIPEDKLDSKIQLFVLSDFQKSQFSNLNSLNDSLWNLKLLKFQEANPSSNLAIDSVWFQNPILQPGFDQTLKLRIVNYGTQDLASISIQLTINSELQGAEEFNISALEKKELEFIIRPENKAIYEGLLKIDMGQPSFDNQLYFSFKVEDPIRVLLLGKSNKSLFEKLYQDSIYDLSFTDLNELSYGEIQNYNLVILNQLEKFPSGLKSAISENLKQGKNIAFIPNYKDKKANDEFLKSLGLREYGELSQAEIKLNKIYWKDLIFENVFTAEPKNSQLPNIKKHYKTSPAPYCLLEMENGDCLLSRKPIYEGQFMLFNSNLDLESSDIARHSILVPIMLNSALYSSLKQALYNSSGNEFGQEFERKFPESDYPLKIKVEGKEIIPQQRNQGLSTELFSLPAEIKPGIYPVIENEEEIGKIAVNIDPRESDWAFWEESDLKEVLANSNVEILDIENINLAKIVRDNYNVRPLWHWFLWAALFLLIIEITLLKLWN